MYIMMNQFASLYLTNKRMVTVAIVLLVTLLVLTLLLTTSGIVEAGPATSGAGHCSC